MHKIMEWLRHWLPLLVVVGILLDLGISLVLIEQNSRSNCWDGVLDQAITHKITPAEHANLYRQAHGCAKL